jgi:hypothetical protein
MKNPPRTGCAVALALLLAGCLPPPADAAADPLAALGENRDAWVREGGAAEAAARRGLWEEAARDLERRVALVPGPPPEPLRRALQVDLYGLACFRALAGKGTAALDALDLAFADGLGALEFEHLLTDLDLESLRTTPRWYALLRRLSWNEEVAVTPAADGAARGVVVEIVEAGDGAAKPREPVAGWTWAVPAPPYRIGPGRSSWRTRLDPGRQAAAKALLATSVAGASGGDRVLLARGEGPVRAAWEILLREPAAFTRAVLEGPPPPSFALLDRGADRLAVDVRVVGAGSAPDPKVVPGVKVVASVEEGLR